MTVTAGKEQALAQISQGVDVLLQNADAAGLGVFQAARETRRALVFGSNSNQNALAPMSRWQRGHRAAARLFHDRSTGEGWHLPAACLGARNGEPGCYAGSQAGSGI